MCGLGCRESFPMFARVLHLLLCALLAGLLSLSGWASVRTEIRLACVADVMAKKGVGGSPSFSSVFASPSPSQVAEPHQENQGCDYDFAPAVHKYLYTHANPINGVDPSGCEFSLLGLNVSQAISGELQAFRTAGIAYAKRVARNSLYGAVIGGAAGEWDAIIAGGDPLQGLQDGAIGGAVFGGLSSFQSIQP